MGVQASGQPVKALENRPVLLPGLDFYFTAYRDLRYDRPIGMTLGPIPWSSIDRWALRHGITDVEELVTLEYHIRAMENAMGRMEQQRESKGGGR